VLNDIIGRDDQLLYEVKSREALSVWETVAGEFVRKHTWAVRVKNRRLLIHTDSPVLANELSLREREYVRKINGVLGVTLLEGMNFASGRIPAKRTALRADDPAGSPVPAALQKNIRNTVSGLKDEELRSVMERFFRSLAKRKR
jgi:hypothetical protein